MSGITNRSAGVQALNFWYDASDLAVLKTVKRGDALAYYDRTSPGFVDTLGSAARLLEQQQTRSGMEKLGHEFGYRYPAPQDFLQKLADSGGVTFHDVTASVQAGVAQAGKLAALGLGAYALFALGGVALVLYGSTRRS